MWQEIITYSIGILVVIYICIKVYRFFYDKKKGVSRCDNCPGRSTCSTILHKQNPSGEEDPCCQGKFSTRT